MAIDASESGSNVSTSVFAGGKVSSVCYAGEPAISVDAFVTGSWDAAKNNITLWNVAYGKSNRGKVIERRHQLSAPSAVFNLFVDETTVAAALENGSVEVYTLSDNALRPAKTFNQLHTRAASNAVCMLNGELISGSENGSIVQLSLQGTPNPTKLGSGLTSIQCMTTCAAYEFASGHGSGQIHLFDIRQKKEAMVLTPMPRASQIAASLNDAITSVDSQAGQPHVIAYGTRSGLVSFVDVRQYRQSPPNLLKVSQDAVTSINFHPVFVNNCVAVSEDACLHLQVSSSMTDNENVDRGRENMTGDGGIANVWLTSTAWNTINLSSLIADEPKQLSSCAVSTHTLLCGSDTGYLTAITNLAFT